MNVPPDTLGPRHPILLATAALLASLCFTACSQGSSDRPGSSPTGVPRSVGLYAFEQATREPDAAVRVIDIAIKPWAATKQIDAIEKRIAGTPEVEIYTWVSKDQALEEFRRQMVTMPSPDAVLDNLPGPGICDGLRILAREENQVDTVKQLFANEPLVDNVEGRYWPSSSGSGSASPAP